jgi:eukaryotic-like serine/threonine-protein kinase
MVEFLERIGLGYQRELWLVRTDQVLRTAHVFEDDDREWVDHIEADTQPWLGFVHPRVAEVHDISWSHGHLVIVVGDERGATFLQAARRLADAREREAWAIAEVIAVAEALDAMAKHDPGLVHRRIYDQVIVGADGRAKVRAPIAYVQAFKTQAYVGRSHSIVTMHGLAPEQALGKHVTPATDVFQLAALLYTAIAQKRPFAGESEWQLLQAIVEAKPPPPPSESIAVWSVLKRSLSADPKLRYPTPAAFADALRHAGSDTPPPAALAKLAAFQPGMRPAPHESAGIIGQRCTKKWEELAATDSEGVRYCRQCKHEVIEVRSLGAVIPLLGKRCISYRPE